MDPGSRPGRQIETMGSFADGPNCYRPDEPVIADAPQHEVMLR
jgi:hypothetical protein